MAPPANVSQTPARTVDCSIPDCQKQKVGGYKTKKGLTDHMQRWHQAAADVLSPMAATTRTLFHSGDKDPERATQGNSAGQVNSPKVITEGMFQCGACEHEDTTNENMTMHMKTHYKPKPMPIIEEPENATAVDSDDGNYPDDDHELAAMANLITVDKIVDTFEDVAYREMNPNDVETIEECHECFCKDQVIDNKEKLIQEKEVLVAEKSATALGLASTLKQKEKELRDSVAKYNKLEKESNEAKDQRKKDTDSLSEAIGSLTKCNNDLKVELAKEKSLRESLQNVNQPEVTIVSDAQVHVQESVQRVTMSKESTDNRCQACDKGFNAAKDLDRHMKDKHTESECPNCNKKSTSEKHADEHTFMDGDIVPETCEKSYCKREFISTAALAKHVKNSHFVHQRSVCTQCGEIINQNMKSHTEACGKKAPDSLERSREVCKHWKRGKCNRGQSCNFSHVGRQDISPSERQSTAKTPELCRNGPACSYLAKGRCKFDHHKTSRHQDRAPQHSRPTQGRGPRQEERTRCRFGANCDRVVNCPHLHSMEDFPMYDQSQRFQKTRARKNQGWSRS